ncbi:hypothetical protein ACRDNQ_13075 [Palleronia sp. KMU-117]|uniref:hypothetical protein n=1 Tax=Palleronia sp. KMU-117 TaxID=3434108 RepID=UPI003D704FC7
MSTALVWISLRFVIAGLPLLLAIFAAERAFASVSAGTGRAAPIWMAYAGFAAVSGVSLLPWAMHLEAVNGAGFALCLISMALWPILGRVLRRGGGGYRDAEAAEVVFRHRRPAGAVMWPAPLRSAPPVAPSEARQDPGLGARRPVAQGAEGAVSPEAFDLAFLRRAPAIAPPAIAMPGRRWHEGACAPSSRPILAF